MGEEIINDISEKELILASDIIRTITKTAKTFNVYPKDNPIYHKFAGELFEKFYAFFEISNELDIDIELNSLIYKKNVVFRSEEKTDNIAMILFSDGLRQIAFLKGITLDEIMDFIDILRFVPKSETTEEDDIVTLLWEKNIRNMGYTAVEDTVEDELAIEEGLLIEDLPLEAEVPSLIGTYAEGDFQVSSESLVFKTLSEKDVQLVNDELQCIDENFLLSSATELFLELLSYEHDMESFDLFAQNLGKIMDFSMQKKDIKGIMKILKGLDQISSSYDEPQQQELLNTIKTRAGSPDNLMTIFRELLDPEKTRQYLLLLGKPVIPGMIQALGILQDRKQRRLLCEILSELGRQDVDVFATALADEKWYVVRNLAMILGMTKQPNSVKYLEKVIGHHDARVRRETVRALESIHTDETKMLFFMLIGDKDQTVRIAALRSLRRFKDPDLFRALAETVSVENLKNKPFEEKRAILETLASLGENNAFHLLSELFKKRGFIEKDEITEIRAAAAFGLGILETPEALSLLEKETGAKKDILRDACIKAMKKS